MVLGSARVEFFESYQDASGAPAVLVFGPFRFSADVLGTVKLHALGSPNCGYRARERAVAACERAYKLELAKLGSEWLAANRELYKEGGA